MTGTTESDQQAISPQEQPHTIFDNPQKYLIVLLVSLAATLSGFASNIYFPSLPTIATDLNVSVELINLTVTSYLIFQGIAPSFWGPISDAKGRRVAYGCTLVVFLSACIGLGLARNYATVLVLRCLQSTGSASTIAIGSGVIGDISTRANRGGLMGIFQAGLLVPVAIGPVIGGALAGSLGWRSVFWFLSIYSGAILIALIVLLPETLRSLVGNGSLTQASRISEWPLVIYRRTTAVQWEATADPIERKLPKRVDIIGPLRIIIDKKASLVILFLAIYYAVWQMSITAMSTLFKTRYSLSETHIGLTFIANGLGSMIGTLFTGRLLDIEYQRATAHHESRHMNSEAENGRLESFPIEKARLRLVPLFALLQCTSIIVFGWTVQYSQKVHIAAPIISTFVTGWTAVSTQSVIMTYLVDVFHDRSAAASASLNMARCLLAAGGTSFIMPMINAIGAGWAFTVCTAAQFVALAALLTHLMLKNRRKGQCS